MSEFLKCKIKGYEDKIFKPKSKWLLKNGETITINYANEQHGIQQAGGMFRLLSTFDECYFNNKGELYHINYSNKDSKDFKYFNYTKDDSRNIQKFVSYFVPLTYDTEVIYECYLTTDNLFYNDDVKSIDDMTIDKNTFNILKKNYQEYLKEISYNEKNIPTITIDEKNKIKTKRISASYDEYWNTATLYCTEEYLNKLGKDGVYKLLCSKLGYNKEQSLNKNINSQSYPNLGF